ncbi:MAG: hypothetical protein RR280_04310 [Bacteroidaceae bacterium]
MKSRLGEYRSILTFLFLAVYPITVMAGQDLFQNTTGVTVHQGLYALFMGAWGALAIFTEKWVSAKEQVVWYRVFIKDLCNATLASAIALLVCVYKGITPAMIGGVCALAGYGGGRTLSWAYGKAMKWGEKLTG